MLVGCYYRCPIVVEEGDRDHPRFYVLAQLVEYNEIADAVKVEMHDLLGSRQYYGDLFQHNVFFSRAVTRCEACPGGAVEGRWGRGTIVSRASEPYSEDEPYRYWIKLPNGRHVKECETELKFDYSQMNFAPDKQLRAYEFQHPTWFINHLKVSKNLHLVNNATYGFHVLAGCRAFLLPHQISTVARCFETTPVRYMLADEVGLGKTVEACSILSILASEKKDLRVLIIVPGALASQWKNELHYKYGLNAAIASPRAQICLLPMEDIGKSLLILSMPWDLAIVDETHRLLANDTWYNQVQNLSRKVTHILLLSATPIQDRNEEYRRLLALLNPEQYEAMSAEHFSWMVKRQKRIQKSANLLLGYLERYDGYTEIVLDDLNGIVETLEDAALEKMVKDIDLSAADQGLSKVKQALAYICENYRIERRVIRNRRQLISEKMARRTLCAIPYSPLSLNENYNEIGAIQNTLAYLADNGGDDEEYVTQTAIPLLSALFSSPWAFEDTLHKLKISDGILLDSAAAWKRQAENEHSLVNVALDEDPDLIKGRLMTAMNYIDQETDILDDETCKLVVFTAHNATLVQFLKLFNTRYADMGIHAVAFGKHMDRDELEDSVYAFQNNPACRVIICDETGGEGRNFQNASQIIHLDLPWNANALEQRIGRLDRLGRDPNMDVLSVVLYADTSVEEQLFHIWKDGMKLFEQSLSGLEIITGELNELIVDALLDDYYTGLTNAFDDILDQAEEMRESVEDEQDFDLGATLYRPLSQGIDNVLGIYASEDDNLFATAMMGWGKQAGLSPEKPTSSGLIEFRESTFSVNAARQSLFIPPEWDKYTNSSIMRREGRLLGSFDRRTAATREDILFFAPGDPVYDSIISNAVGCNRGRCTGIETVVAYNYDGLVFIYNIAPKLDELLENGIPLQTLAQYRMYLPLKQIIVTVPLTARSKEVPEKEIINTLLALRPNSVNHLGRRGGSKMSISPLEHFISRTPPSTWEPLVDKASATAYKRACARLEKRSDFEAAEKEMQRVLNGYRAECIYFERDMSGVDERAHLFDVTLRALKNAKPELDAVCFLRVRSNG
ncbi:SNF2-related protein [Flavonifractor sp. DFI.6.63]|uniref:SNF2-related protein n=1 Tax=Flavonifractor sp. DFI.6.63 TaxID=2963704 RepID=UPI00210EDCEE|nr:SNF2-related protein [Flavonifractor sp. DFI.6.63]MCQ5030915.1 SNF2-related protein [Flavonifractor sp. DFI.6.63]